MINTDLRQFKEELANIVNSYDLPIEAKLDALLLITNKVTEMANEAVMKELKEEEECKKPMQE